MADLTTALMGVQAAPGMSGWGKIGGLFGNSDASYMKGQVAGATAAQKMATARRAVEKNLAIEAQAKRYEDQGAPDLAAMLRAEVNPQQFTGAQLDQQSMGWGNRAWEEAIKPDANLELLNRLNMVRDGKPVALSKIEDHTVINPMVTPAAQDLDLVTALGQAMVADEQASAGRNDALGQAAITRADAAATRDTAHAGLYDTQAAAGGFNPNTGRGRTKPEPQAGEAARPTTQAEYDALPSGALFIDPDDGRTYRKP